MKRKTLLLLTAAILLSGCSSSQNTELQNQYDKLSTEYSELQVKEAELEEEIKDLKSENKKLKASSQFSNSYEAAYNIFYKYLAEYDISYGELGSFIGAASHRMQLNIQFDKTLEDITEDDIVNLYSKINSVSIALSASDDVFYKNIYISICDSDGKQICQIAYHRKEQKDIMYERDETLVGNNFGSIANK